MNSENLVIIPVFNEEKSVTKVIRKVKAHTNEDILVIDDGSSDSSWEKIRSQKVTAIQQPNNFGYGQALITGFQYAIKNRYRTVVTIDCDEQHEPQMIPFFFAELGEEDILSGSRYLGNFAVNNSPPPERKKINLSVSETINSITGFNLTDSFCGFKAYRVDALRKLNITEPGYGMPLQLWVQAWREGLRVKEKPVARIYKDMTRSFGHTLDDSQKRLNYYNGIIKKETDLAVEHRQNGLKCLICT